MSPSQYHTAVKDQFGTLESQNHAFKPSKTTAHGLNHTCHVFVWSGWFKHFLLVKKIKIYDICDI